MEDGSVEAVGARLEVLLRSTSGLQILLLPSSDRVMISTRRKILLARAASQPFLLALRASRKSPEVDVKRGGIRWHLDLREGIDFTIFLLGAFEPSTVRAYERLIRRGNVVFDIGANIGAHTLRLARLAGQEGKVVAFEPTGFAVRKLRRNIALNPELCPRVVVEQAMLVDSEGSGLAPSVYSSWPLSPRSDVHAKHGGLSQSTCGAYAITVDAYVEKAQIAHVDFIKLDVDGHECEVVRGASRLLSKDRPVLLMELCPYSLAEMDHSLEELIELLDAFRYSLETVGRGQRLPMDAGRLRRLIADGASINVVARPAGP